MTTDKAYEKATGRLEDALPHNWRWHFLATGTREVEAEAASPDGTLRMSRRATTSAEALELLADDLLSRS